MLRTLLYWAVVLLISMSYPARPGIWFYVLVVGMVYLKCTMVGTRGGGTEIGCSF